MHCESQEQVMSTEGESEMIELEIAKQKLARLRAARVYAGRCKNFVWERKLATESYQAWVEVERLKESQG
jgi:hypothetical protein